MLNTYSEGLSVGANIGIIFGGIVFILIGVGMIYFGIKLRRDKIEREKANYGYDKMWDFYMWLLWSIGGILLLVGLSFILASIFTMIDLPASKNI